MLGAGRPWQPGEKLKLLFAGYNGTRNTGSDVRVEEMLRQVRRVLGEKQSRAERDDTKFRPHAAAISAMPARCSCPIFFRRSCFAKCASSTA